MARNLTEQQRHDICKFAVNVPQEIAAMHGSVRAATAAEFGITAKQVQAVLRQEISLVARLLSKKSRW